MKLEVNGISLEVTEAQALDLSEQISRQMEANAPFMPGISFELKVNRMAIDMETEEGTLYLRLKRTLQPIAVRTVSKQAAIPVTAWPEVTPMGHITDPDNDEVVITIRATHMWLEKDTKDEQQHPLVGSIKPQ